ncbi:phosphodiester glycosidase family protein [Streptomyces sp. CBMA123]|uniref:phosphodiester glycosidase family protein n=1 Tax=Streptomyces sp. CBMA123 TaxID=1896313 RepID=UPI001661A951|nr:phosphodiester glycosidase family protein [Streptomyces sp. CBMA123]MBD0695796.1 hypothetical protein [Streptomyces sp. CBMA123]
MRKIRPLLPAVLALGLVPVAAPSSSAVASASDVQIPIGQYATGGPRTRTVGSAPQTITDGITYQTYTQGFRSQAPFGTAKGDHWTLALFAGSTPGERGQLTDAQSMQTQFGKDLSGLKDPTHIDEIDAPPGGTRADVTFAGQGVAWALRLGTYNTKDEADAAKKTAEADAAKKDAAAHVDYPADTLGFVHNADGTQHIDEVTGKPASWTAEVIYDAVNGAPTTGPWSIRVVTVDPAKYDLQSTFGGTISNPDKLRDMVGVTGATVAINASEGVPVGREPGVVAKDAADAGYTGDVQGVQVRNDGIFSEANNGRSALILNGRDPADPNGAITDVRIGQVSTRIKVTATDPATHQPDPRTILGVDRPAGHIVGCGYQGDGPDEYAPVMRYGDCQDKNDLTAFRSEWGPTTPTVDPKLNADAFELLLDANWVVQGIHASGDVIPPGQIVLQGLGASATWLKKYAQRGTVLSPSADITDTPTGKSITNANLGVLAGGCGPSLLDKEGVYLSMKADGILGADERGYNLPGFINNESAERHPRTMVGVTAPDPQTGKHKLMLVTVDGRDADTSIGMSILETAQLMKALGAQEALSMGCGGDTAMFINGVLYNNPMNGWGTPDQDAPYERHLPNALVALPKK